VRASIGAFGRRFGPTRRIVDGARRKRRDRRAVAVAAAAECKENVSRRLFN
jgi:hypothetical protein